MSAMDLIMISYHTGFSARGGRSFVTVWLLPVTVLYMGKPPKMRKGNSRVTEKGTQPKGQKKKAENASCCNDPDCDS